jgi:antitoxin MazE
MQTEIVKWGNSQGVRLPKSVLEAARFTSKEVELIVEDNRIIICPAASRRHVTVRELFDGYDGARFVQSELDWGEPVGREVW